jgi:hypothetical protein
LVACLQGVSRQGWAECRFHRPRAARRRGLRSGDPCHHGRGAGCGQDGIFASRPASGMVGARGLGPTRRRHRC